MSQSINEDVTMTTADTVLATYRPRTMRAPDMKKGFGRMTQTVTTLIKTLAVIIFSAGATFTEAAAEISYYHTDHLGTPKALTDEAGNVVWQATHDAFGKATVTTESVTNNLRFPGQYFDEETNLHYNYFRTYDPNVGRYITSDPIGLDGGINTYSYVEGNPLLFIDPFGLRIPRPGQKKHGTSGPVTIGTFGCFVGCASFNSTDTETQVSMEATIGGGITICFGDEEKESKSCEVEPEKDCGIFDPNCDNKDLPPSFSPTGTAGYIVSISKQTEKRYCISLGPHMGLPLPGVGLGGLSE